MSAHEGVNRREKDSRKRSRGETVEGRLPRIGPTHRQVSRNFTDQSEFSLAEPSSKLLANGHNSAHVDNSFYPFARVLFITFVNVVPDVIRDTIRGSPRELLLLTRRRF